MKETSFSIKAVPDGDRVRFQLDLPDGNRCVLFMRPGIARKIGQQFIDEAAKLDGDLS